MPAEATVTTSYGVPLVMRQIAPEDRPRLALAFERLSDSSRLRRFLTPKPRLSGAELTYLTEIDHRTHEALVAVDTAQDRIVGVARYAPEPDEPGTADLAFVVADEWQGQGIATMLTARVVRLAEENAVERLTATTLADNRPARAVLRGLGFRTVAIGGGVLELELRLRQPPAAGRSRA
jgi:RimJ/RimL family protein N-acetyltransferase